MSLSHREDLTAKQESKDEPVNQSESISQFVHLPRGAKKSQKDTIAHLTKLLVAARGEIHDRDEKLTFLKKQVSFAQELLQEQNEDVSDLLQQLKQSKTEKDCIIEKAEMKISDYVDALRTKQALLDNERVKLNKERELAVKSFAYQSQLEGSLWRMQGVDQRNEFLEEMLKERNETIIRLKREVATLSNLVKRSTRDSIVSDKANAANMSKSFEQVEDEQDNNYVHSVKMWKPVEKKEVKSESSLSPVVLKRS